MPSGAKWLKPFLDSCNIARICVERWTAIPSEVLIRDHRISQISVEGEDTYAATFLLTVQCESTEAVADAVEDAIDTVKEGLGSIDLMITVNGQRTQFRGPKLAKRTHYVDLSLTVSGPGSKPMVW